MKTKIKTFYDERGRYPSKKEVEKDSKKVWLSETFEDALSQTSNSFFISHLLFIFLILI